MISVLQCLKTHGSLTPALGKLTKLEAAEIIVIARHLPPTQDAADKEVQELLLVPGCPMRTL
jgi:hypothetical protein